MGREERLELIEALENARGSRVLTYVTGDRAPNQSQIGGDAVRPIQDVLSEIGTTEQLDLFLYTRGGATDVPWRLVSAIRQHCDRFNVMVPSRANSAGTMIALGADAIVMGRYGELGPIDPTLNIQRRDDQGTMVQDSVSVEDVMSFLDFIQKAGVSDQAALSNAMEKLIQRLDAVVLGSVQRTHSHIRDVARRIVQSRNKPPEGKALEDIVETLAHQVYAHDHAIVVKDAEEIGLPVVRAEGPEEDLLYKLLASYESDLHLREPLDPFVVLGTKSVHEEPVTSAVIESAGSLWEFGGTIEIRGRRLMPQTLNVPVSINLQVPAGIDVGQLPAGVQSALQQAQQAIGPLATQAVEAALTAQAPIVDVNVRVKGAAWRKMA